MKNHIFVNLPLDADATESLGRLTEIFMEKPPRSLAPSTGLVIVGFGETEFTPVLAEFEVYGVMGGRLRLRRHSPHRIDDDRHAVVVPFAQREMVDLFMSGIDPQLQNVVKKALSELTEALSDLVADAIPGSAADDRDLLRSGGVALYEEFCSYLDERIFGSHVHPILAAVANPPKEELAAMAEALVNSTSLKRRVTLDAETVGGPIDVLVISKGDGLIWIERKHYFDPKLNHHFLCRLFSLWLFNTGGHVSNTNRKQQTKLFKSYEQLERELMPKRAESRRSRLEDDALGERALEIVRRSIAEVSTERRL